MVKGWNKLKVDLDNLVDVVKNAPYPAMEAGADLVVSQARSLCVSTQVRSTIHRTGPLLTERGNPVVRIIAGDATTLVGRTEKFQLARIIEYGTYGKGKGPPQAAQPYMRIAWRGNKNKIKANMRKAIRTAIRGLNHGS